MTQRNLSPAMRDGEIDVGMPRFEAKVDYEAAKDSPSLWELIEEDNRKRIAAERDEERLKLLRKETEKMAKAERKANAENFAKFMKTLVAYEKRINKAVSVSRWTKMKRALTKLL